MRLHVEIVNLAESSSVIHFGFEIEIHVGVAFEMQNWSVMPSRSAAATI